MDWAQKQRIITMVPLYLIFFGVPVDEFIFFLSPHFDWAREFLSSKKDQATENLRICHAMCVILADGAAKEDLPR